MEDNERNDIYAGDEAWREWFDKCAVSRCGAENAARLGSQIGTAMYSQLARSGIARSAAGEDDPVSVFDAYFMLKGSRDTGKPLKSYFSHRIKTDGLRLLDFVCGTLFGARSGRIHDIVTDWIASIKGWKPRTVRDADGRRHVVWEGAGDASVAELELGHDADPAALIDLAPLRRKVAGMLEEISRKTKVEKAKVALLCYVTAQDIPITETAVLEELETAKSRAYAIREKVMEALREKMRNEEEGNSPLFGRVLLETVEAELSERVRAKLTGDAT
jgi:hypothetical protein